MSVVRGRDDAPDGEPYDDAEWVDVDPEGHWRPTFEERSRSMVVLLVLVGVLLLGAAAASLDDGDGERDRASAETSSTSTTSSTTTTTEPPDPASVDGEPPPAGCEVDDRNANPLRDLDASTVLVLNGTPESGHAGRTTDRLQELGYSAMVPDNATLRPTTSIEYLPGFCAEADRLHADLGVPSATVSALEEDDDVFLGRAKLLITLGRDSN